MLRVYFLQQWYGLADEALEDTIYDSQAMRHFAGINLTSKTNSVPDATTLLHFRHLLEAQALTGQILTEVNAYLSEQHLLLREGTIVDATIIAAPSSTKNRRKERDPEMHQTKKGNEWHFGMKAHICVDAASGLVHTVVATAANVADITQAHALLHGEEKVAFTDAGYLGVEKRPEIVALAQPVQWHIAAKRGRVKAMREGPLKETVQESEKGPSAGACAGGASLSRDQEPVWVSQGALPRVGQERGAIADALCAANGLQAASSRRNCAHELSKPALAAPLQGRSSRHFLCGDNSSFSKRTLGGSRPAKLTWRGICDTQKRPVSTPTHGPSLKSAVP